MIPFHDGWITFWWNLKSGRIVSFFLPPIFIGISKGIDFEDIIMVLGT